MNIGPEFQPAATQVSTDAPIRERSREALLFNEQYDLLFAKLQKISRYKESLDAIEPQIRKAVKDFLIGMNYPMALKNFESLLHEKSGKKFRRDDGSVSWYHEFIPLLTELAIFRLGKDNGGIDFEDNEEFGGMELFIASKFRHDSVEDHTKPELFRRAQFRKLSEVRFEYVDYDIDGRGRAFVEGMLNNNRLISQKYVIGADGEKIKEDVVDYSYRMVADDHATPQVFMQKQGDINHNFSTFFGAPKFTADKRLKRCNEREDMYGRRYAMTDIALEKWPAYANGIRILDSMMGMQLYMHFRYLQNVDEEYKKAYDIPVGIKPYVGRALSLELPDPKFNMIHIGMTRMMNSVDPEQDPEKYQRLRSFMEKVIKPSLEGFKVHFPYLFSQAGIPPQPQLQPLP